MSLSKIFSNLKASIAQELKKEGFLKKGDVLYKMSNNNCLQIGFQKSQYSTASEILFTINLSIHSEALRVFFLPEKLADFPKMEEAQWRERLKPEWWKIDENTVADTLIEEVREAIAKQGLPLLFKYHSDLDLETLWSSGQAPGLTNTQRMINLSVLLKEHKNLEELQKIITQLESLSEKGSGAAFIKVHLRSLKEK